MATISCRWQLAAVAALFALVASQANAQARTWKDRTGKFSIEATLEEVKDGKVVLKRADGQTMEVPLDRLSEADAKFVREYEAAENPFAVTKDAKSGAASAKGAAAGSKGAAASSAKGRAAARRAAKGGDDEPSQFPTGTMQKVNLRDAKNVRPKTFTSWSFKPPAGLATIDPKQASKSVDLDDIPDAKKFFEKVLLLKVSDDGKQAIVVRETWANNSEHPRYLDLADLSTGTSGGMIALPPKTEVMDAWPDDGLVMLRPDEFGSGKNGLLTFAKIEGGQLVPQATWAPYEREQWSDIDNAWFLSGDRAMTINQFGAALTIWDIKGARAVLNVPVKTAANLKTAISPDRKLLAVVMSDGIAMIDLVAGTHVGTIPTDMHAFDLAIRDDNQQLAASTTDGIRVWDLSTGKLLRDFVHPAVRGSKVGWAGQFLTNGDERLFDPMRRIMVWDYEQPRAFVGRQMHGGKLWGVLKPEDAKATTLVSATVPHAEAIELARELPSPEELLAFKRGDNVAIELDINPGIASTDEVRSAIVANLEEAGLKVVDKADLVVSAVCQPKEAQTIKIRTNSGRFPRPFGGPGPLGPPGAEEIVERTITPHSSSIELKLRGEKLWSRGVLARPGMTIAVGLDETLDGALERLTKPNIDVIKKAKFPSELARPGKATPEGAYGKSGLAWDE